MTKKPTIGLRKYPTTNDTALITTVIPKLFDHPVPDAHLIKGHSTSSPKITTHKDMRLDPTNNPGYIMFAKIGVQVDTILLTR